MRTPPHVSRADFEAALQGFAKVVGQEWVFTSDEDLDLYRDAYSPVRDQPDERVASAALAPSTTEEVQEIVRIANRYKIPIYAISTGRNLGYGGSAPVFSGSVVIDLKRMNRILEVDDRRHFAVVEPGVSYFELYRHIREKGLKVMLDVPDPGWGSLIGNALDHGIGYTVSGLRNHFEAHCGMEVVLPSGEVMRTGMGALPGSKTWHDFKTGIGPVLDGIFTQSNFGIVTKMGFWLLPQPEAVLQGYVWASRYEDLDPLIDTVNYIENIRLTTGLPDLSSPLLASPDIKMIEDSFYTGPPKMEPRHIELLRSAQLGYSAELERYGLENKIPYWQISLPFYGPPKVIEAQWEAACSLFSKAVKGVQFKKGETQAYPLTEPKINEWHLPKLGVPNMDMFGLGVRSPYNPTPSFGHLWFSPIIPRSAEGIRMVNRLFDQVRAEFKIPTMSVFSLPFFPIEHSFIVIFPFLISDDPEQNKHSIAAYRRIVQLAAEQGLGEYRTAPLFQDQVTGVYSFNNNILRRVQETLKDALDPNGIMAAGRYGIWPKYLREKNQ